MANIHVVMPQASPEADCDHLTAGAFCAPCVAEAQQAATRAITESQEDPGLKALELANSGNDTGSDGDTVDDAVPAQVRFSGNIGYENQYTGDGRYIATGALRADPDTLPLPLRYAPEDIGGHDGAYVVGLIESMTTMDDGAIFGEGFIDTTTDQGMAVYNGLQNGTVGGISMDLDDMEGEVFARPVDENQDMSAADAPEGYQKMGDLASDDMVLHINSARVRGATLVQIPAFATARIGLVASGGVLELGDLTLFLHLSAAAPVTPPSAWFEDPKFTEPTPLTFTKDGRVYGHVAIWNTCHTGFPGACVTPPKSITNYAYFRTGILTTADGNDVPVGHLTMATGHAGPNMSASAAMAHYDNTGQVGADVSAGDDAFGIWVNGAIRSELSDEDIRALKSAPMSGDWRRIGGNLELMAVLAVNLPGFPVLRTKALVASGATQCLLVPIEAENNNKDVDIQVFDAITVELTALKAEVKRMRRVQLSQMINQGD